MKVQGRALALPGAGPAVVERGSLALCESSEWPSSWMAKSMSSSCVPLVGLAWIHMPGSQAGPTQVSRLWEPCGSPRQAVMLAPVRACRRGLSPFWLGDLCSPRSTQVLGHTAAEGYLPVVPGTQEG